MTWEFHRALAPDRTLVVDMGELARGHRPHLERYGIRGQRYAPGVAVTPFDGHVFTDEGLVRRWLDGLEVVYTAETFYDLRLPEWCAAAGVRLVVHVMPEFYKWAGLELPGVVWWAPTPWRLEHLPEGTRVVPVPIAGDRFALQPAPAPVDGRLRLLHTGGHQAAQDRNGTRVLLRTIPYLREPMRIRFTSQGDVIPKAGRVPPQVELDVRPGGVEDYWTLYGDADLLVLPRRYGGLSLPVQEAMAAGLGVVMTDVAPNDWWPTSRVAAAQLQDFPTGGGVLQLADASIKGLAARLNNLARDPERVAALKADAVAWARAHTWEQLAPVYREALADAAR